MRREVKTETGAPQQNPACPTQGTQLHRFILRGANRTVLGERQRQKAYAGVLAGQPPPYPLPPEFLTHALRAVPHRPGPVPVQEKGSRN
jgi:hypothetical protein